MDENKTWQKLAAEVLGTAFLVFIGAGSVPATLALNGTATPFGMDSLVDISWAFALIVVVTVYVFGYIGGNHINPAVTVGLAVRGFFPWKDVPGYLAAQVVGAILGAFAIIGVLGDSAIGKGITSYGATTPVLQAGFAEFLGTFMLVFTVFGVIHRKAAGGWFGLVIGFVVFAIILVVGPTTGAAINPARYLGPIVVAGVLGHGDAVQPSQIAVYIIADILGGVVGAWLHGVIAKTDADAKAA
ncbi:MAG: aquaporin family protein [Salinibacterium sp.]|nr:MAG: aquaporin family protein [Salinibacterium sp.]